MDSDLRNLLRNTTIDTKTDSLYTHFSYYGPKSRWSVPPHNQTAFWSGYCDLVDRKINGRQDVAPDPDANLCLAERPQEVMPQIAQFTFRFHADEAENRENWEPYDDDFLQYLCHVYQTVLNENFRVITETQMELVVAVLESSTYWYEEDKDTVQRFIMMEVRLQFPYGRIDANMQNKIIRPRVIQMLRNNNAMNKLQRAPMGDWEQIISYTSVDLPIQMYGSGEISGRPKLELTHIWPHITKHMLDENAEPEEIPLTDAFIPSNHMHVQALAVNREIFEQSPNLKYWIPMFLSLGNWPTIMLPMTPDNVRFNNTINNSQLVQTTQAKTFGSKRPNDHFNNDNEMELCEQMIQMISSSRFLNEAYWLDIGKAFYASDEGGDNGLSAWTTHTERSL